MGPARAAKRQRVATEGEVQEATRRLVRLEEHLARFPRTQVVADLLVSNKLVRQLENCRACVGDNALAERFQHAIATLRAHEAAYAAKKGMTLDKLKQKYQ